MWCSEITFMSLSMYFYTSAINYGLTLWTEKFFINAATLLVSDHLHFSMKWNTQAALFIFKKCQHLTEYDNDVDIVIGIYNIGATYH